MFGIGIQELMIILVVALLVVGPTKLPGVARAIGKGLKELRKASDDLRGALLIDDDEPPRRYSPPPPRNVDAPLENAAPAELAAGAGIHGSLAATANDDDGPRAVPADEGTVSRGEEGGDPNKRALEPPPPRDDEHGGLLPGDPEVNAMLDGAREQVAAARADVHGVAQARYDDATALDKDTST